MIQIEMYLYHLFLTVTDNLCTEALKFKSHLGSFSKWHPNTLHQIESETFVYVRDATIRTLATRFSVRLGSDGLAHNFFSHYSMLV